MHALQVQAIAAALSNDWENAVTLNQKILQDNPSDPDALNRLGYAFKELGRIEEAQEIFNRVLTIDPCNTIATKNLLKMNKMPSDTMHGTEEKFVAVSDILNGKVNPSYFIEEPGKTKTSNLIRIASKNIIANLRIGLRVHLLLKSRHTIAVMKGDDACIGYLPDDLSFLLTQYISGGNLYEVFIKSIEPNQVTVFIKETKKSRRFADIPSFIDTRKLQHKVVGIMHTHRSAKPSTIPQFDDEIMEIEKETFENR